MSEEERMLEKKKRFVLHALMTGLILIGMCCKSDRYPDGMYAELHTNKGLIVLSLEYEKVPMTVANFVGLAEGTIKNDVFPEGVPFFSGSKFHRVVQGHVIQAGIPNADGDKGLGYEFPNEIHPELSHNRAGVLGMANAGPHTNGSQFYITLGDRSYLDGDYTVFGEVIAGLAVVFDIVQGDVINEINIVRSGREARQFRADNQTFDDLILLANKREEEQENEKKAQESAAIQKNWPDAIETESGMKYVIVVEGEGEVPESGTSVIVRYSGEVLGGKKFFSASNGLPDDEPPAEKFVMRIGKNAVNPGFDQAISQMRAGEKRILILPSHLAYGTGGFYAREIQGKKRFVISPGSTLVYEVDLLEKIAGSLAD
jgi:cyclophilin family peptidyl-prolyl cis-trans isomerase